MNRQNQLQVVDQQPQQPYIAQVQVSPEQALQAYQDLRKITAQVLVKDTDYGTIPGTPKPSLFKPGAENLLRFYGLGHRIQLIERVTDWDNGFFFFSYKVVVHRTNENGIEHVLSECEGSANSKEKRYRNQDPFMLVNTLQKMAIKRALVGATLQATGASGLFTQDIEDMDLQGNQNYNRPPQRQQNNNYQRNNSNSSGNGNMTGQATEPQIKAIYSSGKGKGLEAHGVKQLAKKLHGVDSLNDLTKQQASEMITLFNQTNEHDLKGMLGTDQQGEDPFASEDELIDIPDNEFPFD